MEVDSAAKCAEKERKAKNSEKRKEKHTLTNSYINTSTTKKRHSVTEGISFTDSLLQLTANCSSSSNELLNLKPPIITSVAPPPHSPTVTSKTTTHEPTKTTKTPTNLTTTPTATKLTTNLTTKTTTPLITYAQSSVSVALSSFTITDSNPRVVQQQKNVAATTTTNALQNVVYVPLSTKTVMETCNFKSTSKDQKNPSNTVGFDSTMNKKQKIEELINKSNKR